MADVQEQLIDFEPFEHWETGISPHHRGTAAIVFAGREHRIGATMTKEGAFEMADRLKTLAFDLALAEWEYDRKKAEAGET
jgi:hypothetical protein